MRRVVITGLGAASVLGLELDEIEKKLRSGESCITFCPQYEEHGFNSLVWGGLTDWDARQHLPRKSLKFMGRGSEFTSYAALQAIADGGLKEGDIKSDRCGVIVGCGEGSTRDMFDAAYAMEKHNKPRRLGIKIPQTMGSTRSANISLLVQNRGMSMGISDACATGLVNIGYAYQVIKWGEQDVVLAGGGESGDWTGASYFDAMGVLSTRFNHCPAKASRPFDKKRDGFVLGEGGGVVVVEELEQALSRGAPIYGEIVSYASNCDGGYSMVAPNTDGQIACIKKALDNAAIPPDEIDYINTHGTSTVAGDPSEIKAINSIFTTKKPMLSSTKSQIGHAIGGAGAIELIAALVMLKGSFIAPSINLEELDELCEYPNIITETKNVEFDTLLTNNFAFGGSNSTMIIRKFK